MKILVTGGAGYIGSHAVQGLIQSGYDVVVADNFATGHRQALHPEAILCRGDIRDRRFLADLFQAHPIDAVLHFAASSLVGESMLDPLKYYDNNLTGTQLLLEAMVKAGVDKIVFSSTAAVYGEPDETPLKEFHTTKPLNPYGETKLAMERMMQWCSQVHGVRFVSLRYFNVGGAHTEGAIGEAHDPETHLIPLILQVPLGRRESLSIFGDDYPTRDGTCVRDYIHIEDLVEAHILALKKLTAGHPGGIYNLGTGEGYTVLEMLNAARKITGHSIPAVVSPRRAGDPAVLVASPDKAMADLGWKPQHTSIEAIIASAWRFHQSHPHGYGN